MGDQEATQYCTNCKRDIASVNYVMHEIHCRRNIILCKACGEPVPRSEMDDHFEEYHAKVTCDLCREEVEKGEIDSHKEDTCKKRPVLCPYCELQFPFNETQKHQDQCGSRTDKCEKCDQYIMLKDAPRHEDTNCAFPTPAVAKSKTNSSNTNASRMMTDFPPEFSSSFVRNEVDRMMNPAGPLSYQGAQGGFSFETENDLPPRLKLTNPARKQNRAAVRKTGGSSSTNNSRANRNQRPSQTEDTLDTETDLLARHLMQDLSPFDEMGHFPEEATISGVMIPCEFCDELIISDDLVLHQSGCNPEASHVKFDKPNNLAPASPAQTRPPNVVNNRGMFNDWNTDFEDFGATSYDSFADENDTLELPCEFCGCVFKGMALFSHQVQCELNPTATPRTRTPAVQQEDLTLPGGLTRSNRRQQDPAFSFQSELESRLGGLQLDDYDEIDNIPNNASGDARRKQSATKRKQILDDLIHNPTGHAPSNIASHQSRAASNGSGDGFHKYNGTKGIKNTATRNSVQGQAAGVEPRVGASNRTDTQRSKPKPRNTNSSNNTHGQGASNTTSNGSGNTSRGRSSSNKPKKPQGRTRRV